MFNPNSEELYNRIFRDMLNTRWLEEAGLEQQYIRNFLESPGFIESLNRMVESQDYSCRYVLMLCQELLAELAGDAAPSDWLQYIYQFALSKSFPEAVTEQLNDTLDKPCTLYLRLLRSISAHQILSGDGSWQFKYPMVFLNPQEVEELEYPGEYKTFIQAFNSDYVYELMKLSHDVQGLTTLDHVCGVHFLSLYIGRQLKDAGMPIDLGRVSGAAAGHDIGKYGCRSYELKRVPYLHYYYTDQWFKKFGINYIRHIALNHSTWDLELENLPLESLILIYSDFRVKSIRQKNGKSGMHIFNLHDSFDVILNKLDNVDDAKQKRYHRVYAKLKDFEDYMLHLGVSVDPDKPASSSFNTKASYNFSLMKGSEVIENIKYLAINHNISMLYQFRDEFSLENILQLARSQNDWKILREYIRVFEEYSTYLTQKQKLQTIKLLYDLLIHPEDDIRRHCAELIGTLIASYDEDYRKEIPEDVTLNPPDITSVELFDEYLRLFLMPGHKIIPAHRAWIGYSTSIMVSSLFSHCQNKLYGEYKKLILKYYSTYTYRNRETLLYLLKIAEYLPLSESDDRPQQSNKPPVNIELSIDTVFSEGTAYHLQDDSSPVFDFVIEMLKKQNIVLRLSALETALCFIPQLPGNHGFIIRLKELFQGMLSRSSFPSENYLRLKTAKALHIDDEYVEKYSHFCKLDSKKIPDLFLNNLKTATDWVVKKINVEVLLDHAVKYPEVNCLHTAIHFCNLLKVSAVENVRSYAGESILYLMPHLPIEQRNDVAVELVRALEIEGYRFTEYIPYYLGRMVLYLQPIELDELIDDLIEKIKQSKPQIKSLLLKTIGICIANYHVYKDRFSEKEESFKRRLVKMLGVLLNGLGDYNQLVKQVAFSVFGKDIFGSKNLTLKQKEEIFNLTAKKLLTLSTDNKSDVLQLLANSAGLNHIYRFISDYNFFVGWIVLKSPEKIAFFPGTFDPFTLSHKEIVRAIRDMGFEVYLAVDEFSWSKRTLPNLLRRKIISMSIANEPDVYLFPENTPVNLANKSDLKTIKNCFKNSNIFIVVGSDVILNASSYAEKVTPDSVYSFPHIIIERELRHNKERESKLEKILENMSGDIIRLSLPKNLMSISSTQIRGNIDNNRDISSLVDPLVEQYIYENDFYRKEPQEKALIESSMSIDIKEVRYFTPDLMEELISFFDRRHDLIAKKLNEFVQKPSARLILVRDKSENNRLLGFSASHWIRFGNLFAEINNSKICEYIRESTAGRITFIDGIFTEGGQKNRWLEQVILTETLALCLSRDYEYAMYRCMLDNYPQQSIYELLGLQGFGELPFELENPIFAVNMTNPCVFNLDVEANIKEPFRGNARVKQAVAQSRKKVQEAMTKLYPGQLLLSFDMNVQHELMIKKICAENGVPSTIMNPRKLGPAMCVPYGNILDRYVIPNTVTKALHTEKLFTPDMKSFSIGAFPHYLDLEIQARVIHSFNRSVILVDDLLHKGHRLRAIGPIFEKEGVQIRKIIVGILSGRGRELMDIQDMAVDSVYFLPRLRAWFNENSLYPFIGGDALWRGEYPERNLLPSINLILPYTSPKFITAVSKSSVYNLSKAAMESAYDILSTIENEYHELNERNLNLASLGAVFKSPRCPDHGRSLDYDLSLSPSNFIINDIELLSRLENIIVK